MTTELEPNRDRILELSRGWIWRLHLIGPEGSTARIDQSHPDAAHVDNSIQFPVTDLPWVAFWIYGSYTADEWAPSRRLSDGTVLFMDPNPKPEVQIEQRRSLHEPPYASSRGNKTDAALTLFEEDLKPLVAWLRELSSEFGVDFESQRGRRIQAHAEPAPRSHPISPAPEDSNNSSVFNVERTDSVDCVAEESCSTGPAVTGNSDVAEYHTPDPPFAEVKDIQQRREHVEPRVRATRLQRLSEVLLGALSILLFLVMAIWQFAAIGLHGIIIGLSIIAFLIISHFFSVSISLNRDYIRYMRSMHKLWKQ